MINLEFGSDLPKVKVLPARIRQMWRVYGKHPSEKCKSCLHLVYHQPGQNKYLKCDLNKITAGPGTDWKAGWEACGKWEKRNKS